MERLRNWQASGKLYTRTEFLIDNPNADLKGACEDVMLYDSGHYIQGLFDGTWYESNSNRSKHLGEVERNIFEKNFMQKLDK